MQSQLPWPESYDYGNGQGNCTPLVGSISAWAVWISGWLTAHTAAHPQQPKIEGILEEEVRLGAQSRDWNPPRITCAVDRWTRVKIAWWNLFARVLQLVSGSPSSVPGPLICDCSFSQTTGISQKWKCWFDTPGNLHNYGNHLAGATAKNIRSKCWKRYQFGNVTRQ